MLPGQLNTGVSGKGSPLGGHTSTAPASCLSLGKHASAAHARVLLRVWSVKELACHLHPRILTSMLPSLVRLPLTPAGSGDTDCDASTLVSQYWEHHDAAEGGLLPQEVPSLFLQPLVVNPAAAQLLCITPTPSSCASALAQQFQFQPSALQDQNSSAMQVQALSSLAEVCRDMAYTLSCTATAPAACTTGPAPLTGLGSAAAQAAPTGAAAADTPLAGHSPKQALCGAGLIASVSAAYCAAPEGMLLPVLVLEHSAAGREAAWATPALQMVDHQQQQQQQQQPLTHDNRASQAGVKEGDRDVQEAPCLQPRPSATRGTYSTPFVSASKDPPPAGDAVGWQGPWQGPVPEAAPSKPGAVWHPLRQSSGERRLVSLEQVGAKMVPGRCMLHNGLKCRSPGQLSCLASGSLV